MFDVRRRRLLVAIVAAVVIGFVICVGYVASNYRIYTIHTGSMSPTIPIGSAVVIRKGPVRVGQVISFRPLGSNDVVTHRLIGINANGTLLTKGDANRSSDVTLVTRADVVGAVVAAPPYLGTWLTFAFHSPSGIAFDGLFLLILAVLLSGSNAPTKVERAAGAHRVSRGRTTASRVS